MSNATVSADYFIFGIFHEWLCIGCSEQNKTAEIEIDVILSLLPYTLWLHWFYLRFSSYSPPNQN